MDELHRQAYLRAMGFTPWVAGAALPGAAPSPRLAAPAPPEPAEMAASAMRAMSAAASPENAPVPAGAAADAGRLSLPSLEKALEGGQAPAPQAPAPRPPTASVAQGPRFTLQAFATPNVWVVLEQEQADAPGFGREAQQLAANLLRVWHVGPGQPRRFLCPPDGRPMAADQAALALGAFLGGLGRSGTQRILLCASEATAALILPARFRAVPQGHGLWLAVSSLAEMLAEPAEHKRRTWRAMVEAGFHA